MGAERIRNNDLTQNIEYSGDVEFENVCHTFNEMRRAILEEQEKNRKYAVETAAGLFFVGMIAISAMLLLGISGSILLLILGAYFLVITAIKGVLSLGFSYIPSPNNMGKK